MQFSAFREGIAAEHALFVASGDTEPSSILTKLPYNLVEESRQVATPDNTTQQPPSNLTIAWQYEKYLKNKESGQLSMTQHGKPFCHSYDLNRHIKEEFIINNPLVHQLLITSETSYKSVYSSIARIVQKDHTKYEKE